MKKNIFIIALAMGAIFITFHSHATTQKKPWTFLVYMAAANSLSDYAQYDIQEMMNVGSNANVNILVYLTIHQNGQPKQTKKLYVEKGKLTQIGTTTVRDSGDIATFADAVHWACVDYPSDYIAIDMWNHGAGPLNRSNLLRGICYDDDTGHYLTDRDCLNVFSWAQNNLLNGKKIDLITCDACLMASLEMAYTFASCAHYFVASQETIPANGYQYNYLLSSIATQNMDPLSFAKKMVQAYSQEYTGTSDYTLSAMDLSALQPLVDNVNSVATILSTQLKGKNASAAKSTVQKCTASSACLSFNDGIYLDLHQIYKNLLQYASKLKLDAATNQKFTQLLKTGIALFPTIIIANTTSQNYLQAGGMSIYFDKHTIDPSYPNLYWTEHNPNWLAFLKSYLQASSGVFSLF